MRIHIAFLWMLLVLSCQNHEGEVKDKHGNAKHEASKHTCGEDGVGDSISSDLVHTITVFGEVKQVLSLTPDSLKKMEVKEILNYELVCLSGTKSGKGGSCKGVLLKHILEKAQLQTKHHKDRNFYIVCKASDNYMATFSWGEIFNHSIGDSTYVIFEENGKPITEKGEMKLITLSDIKSGPRHVYLLKEIEVRRVEP